MRIRTTTALSASLLLAAGVAVGQMAIALSARAATPTDWSTYRGDAAGNLYIAGDLGSVDPGGPDSVVVLDPSGELLRRIALPASQIAVTPDGSTLLVDYYDWDKGQAYALSQPDDASAPVGSAGLPAPYGPAENGSIVYGKDGDIWVADAAGDDPRLLIGGPDTDAWPIYSRDGSRTACSSGGPRARSRGSCSRTPTAAISFPSRRNRATSPGPTGPRTGCTSSPNGPSTGSSPSRCSPPTAARPSGRWTWAASSRSTWPGSGHPTGGDRSSPDTQGRARTRSRCTPSASTARACAPSGTPHPAVRSGTWRSRPTAPAVAYWNFEPGVGSGFNLYRARSRHRRPEGAVTGPGHARSGLRASIPARRHDRSSSRPSRTARPRRADSQLVIAPLDGSTPARTLGPAFADGDRESYDISPDGTTVMFDLGGATWFIDIATGVATEAPEYMPDQPSWQRR